MLAPESHQPLWDMTEFTPCPYSKSEIVGAGKALAGSIAYGPEAVEVFRIAHSWRLSAVYPMRRVRAELSGKLRAIKAEAITAARMKRMVSIRKKLRTTPLTLYQMQDLGGCRAIIADQPHLDRLIQRYMDGGSAHRIVRDDDHISAPRASTGYRSRHLTFKFSDPDGNPDFNRHFIEVQFRTQQQHHWATAVEAVGLVRGEDLKGGVGSADWLRLFQLMAGHMADIEQTAPVPDVSPDFEDRRRELTDISARLDALRTLDSYNRAIQHTESYIGAASYYLIQYDIARREVSVSPFRAATVGSDHYASAENNAALNTVLVEVDRVADLRQAYPNYFLDVAAFTDCLRAALSPLSAPKRAAKKLPWYEDWKNWRQKDR